MKQPRTCETCLFYCKASQMCGNYDVYADDARAKPTLCGETGESHVQDEPLMAPWMWGLVVVIAVSAAYGNWPAIVRVVSALADFATAGWV